MSGATGKTKPPLKDMIHPSLTLDPAGLVEVGDDEGVAAAAAEAEVEADGVAGGPLERVVAEQLDIATVFVREWRYLEGERRDAFVAERRRYEERFRALFREGRELGELRTDLDDATAALLALSAANWAYTWLRPGSNTDQLADRLYAALLDGMRGYASR